MKLLNFFVSLTIAVIMGYMVGYQRGYMNGEIKQMREKTMFMVPIPERQTRAPGFHWIDTVEPH